MNLVGKRLKKSEAEHSTIVFTHTTIGMYIRSVETGEKITGVVEELIHGINNSVGFTLRHYMDIFLIPDNHPQLLVARFGPEEQEWEDEDSLCIRCSP